MFTHEFWQQMNSLQCNLVLHLCGSNDPYPYFNPFVMTCFYRKGLGYSVRDATLCWMWLKFQQIEPSSIFHFHSFVR